MGIAFETDEEMRIDINPYLLYYLLTTISTGGPKSPGSTECCQNIRLGPLELSNEFLSIKI